VAALPEDQPLVLLRRAQQENRGRRDGKPGPADDIDESPSIWFLLYLLQSGANVRNVVQPAVHILLETLPQQVSDLGRGLGRQSRPVRLMFQRGCCRV
jgi:hypothetical protein